VAEHLPPLAPHAVAATPSPVPTYTAPVASELAQTEPAPPAPTPETSPKPLPAAAEPPRTSDWEAPQSLHPNLPLRYLSNRQRHVIADTLRAHGRHVVTIESSYGDPASREFAHELGAAFGEAGWTVRGIHDHHGLPLASGVTVSAASFPPEPETRAVYEALLTAGIAVSQQLDPRQHHSETVVLVGAPL